MFENEDFDLDETWFAEDIVSELSKTNVNSTQECVPKQSLHNSSTTNSRINRTEKPSSEAGNSKRMKLKRKFPGPAGLFPENNDFAKSSNNNSIDSNSFILSTQYLCSQNLNLIFEEITWKRMCKDFKEGSGNSSLLDKYNIAWIKNNITHNLVNKKVPILAGIIKQIRNTAKSPIFVLADPTGELEALISLDLYEKFSEYLIVNSVLILKKFSILSVNVNKHYVNITDDNLERIYFSDETMDDADIILLQNSSTKGLKQEIKMFISIYEETDQKHILNNLHSSGCRTYQNESILNNVTNTSSFKSKQYDKKAATDTISKNNTTTKTENLQQVRHDCVSSNKNHILSRVYQKDSRDSAARPSTSANIFDQSNDILDIDLALEDFQEEFLLPAETETNDNNKIKDSKKREYENSNVLSSKSNKNDLSRANSNTRRIAIDCSQISILTQNNENPDLIKEIFNDVDAEALFDDF